MTPPTATLRARDMLGVGTLTNASLTTWLHGLPGVDQVGAHAATAVTEQRIGVRKTYKLYIGGALPRSESGRT